MIIKNKLLKYLKYIQNNEKNYGSFYNASIRKGNYIYIKPSGIDANKQKRNNISKVYFNNKISKSISGLRPSVDFHFHKEIYLNFKNINSVIHTHFKYSTIWAQSLKPIPIYGTTHADHFKKEIPITKQINPKKDKDYDNELSNSIVEVIKNYNQSNLPGLLIANHGMISLGENIEQAFENLFLIEFIAELGFFTKRDKKIKSPKKLYKFHFERKNGINKFYGQK